MDANGHGTNLLSFGARVEIPYGFFVDQITRTSCNAWLPLAHEGRQNKPSPWDGKPSAVQRLDRLAYESKS